MGTEALIERQIAEIRRRVQASELDLRDVGKLLIEFWDQDFPAALLNSAAALKAAEAKIADLRSIANVNGDWTVKYSDAISRAEKAESDLTAARAEIERLREGLRPALDIIQQMVDPKQFASSSQHVWAQAVEAEARLRALLGEQGK